MLIVLLLLAAWVAVNVGLLAAVAYADRSGHRRLADATPVRAEVARRATAATGR